MADCVNSGVVRAVDLLAQFREIEAEFRQHKSHGEAALFWYEFGFPIMPLNSLTSRLSVDPQSWFQDLEIAKVRDHWARHPDHLIYQQLDDPIVAFYARNPSAITALERAENFAELKSSLVIEIPHGAVHYFSIPDGITCISAPSAKNSTDNRVGIRRKGEFCRLPPGEGMNLKRLTTTSAADLGMATQDFVDIIVENNEVPPPETSLALKAPVPRDNKGVLDASSASSETDAANSAAETIDMASSPAFSEDVLTRFSLRGKADEFAAELLKQAPLLGELAFLGQWTVLYGAPNSGKTLLTLALVGDAVEAARIDSQRVSYINLDDHATGLAEKLKIADAWGIHVLAESHKNFRARDLLKYMREMIANGEAKGVVVIIDTLKKIVDLMDKGRASYFGRVARAFVMAGGTLITLAHTNKHPRKDGTPVYGGTSDIVDDADAVYTIQRLDGTAEDEKLALLQNIKCRGPNILQACYRYSVARSLAYAELLDSVSLVDDGEIEAAKIVQEQQADQETIDAIVASIQDGVVVKMELVKAVADSVGCSRRVAQRVLEKYTGTDASRHFWKFEVQDRGAKVYSLLPTLEPASE